ncbi:MAG: hypothetical protein ABFD94_16305 [Armatimonadia bacterium]
MGSVPIFLALLLLTSHAFAAATINSAIDKPQVTVGEPFTYTVTLVLPRGATPKLPGETAKFKLLEVRDYKPQQAPQADGSVQHTLQYTLVSFDTGTQGVKDFKVPVRMADGTSETWLAPPVEIKVASVLPPQGKVEPKGFYGPITLKAWWADWLLPVLIALAILAVAALIIWRLRKRRPAATVAAAPEVILAPDQAALRALERLREDDPVAAGDFLGFYLRLDETLRAWLQARFDVPAMERTTMGIMYLLRVRRDTDEWRTEYLDLLKAANRVKYAKLLPTDGEAHDHLDQAQAVIEQAVAMTVPAPSADVSHDTAPRPLSPPRSAGVPPAAPHNGGEAK